MVLSPGSEVRAVQLLEVLAAYDGKIKVLSLDCFDTLLWRTTATPADVFHDLQNAPPFRALGLTARLRAQAEEHARGLRQVRAGQTEVRLREIYQAAFPTLGEAELDALAEAELLAEIRTCFAFPPMVELIRAAKARGHKVVIVSDIYFDEAQLRRLLGSALPADAMAAIDRVYCSSEHRHGKTGGLFRRVVADLRVRPDAILHLGDNVVADVSSALTAGLRAHRFVHHGGALGELLRLTATATCLLDPAVRHSSSLPNPYQGVLAAAGRDDQLLGYAAAGPVLHAFGRFVLDEVAAMRAPGKTPKVLFLMRDAYLPQKVCEAIAGEDVGHAVSISRFVAYASSFRTAEDVDRYLAKFAGSKRFDALARQLLLPDALARDIIAAASKKNRPVDEFIRRVRRPDVLQTIFAESRKYCARLRRYLENSVELAPGDTLVFVDLGYEGTAQRQLEPIFRDEWEVELQGRYLLVVGTPGWEGSRKGLIDPSWCDERAIMSLVDYVALLEDICTADQESVVDYDNVGRPIFTPNVIAREQIERVKPIQEACRAFAADAEKFFAAVGKRPDPSDLRRTALGVLGRMFYFATQEEMAYLEGFHLDMNLATDDALQLFDRGQGLAGLRRRGLFFMEQNLKSRRMNYPIELRYAGLELSVTLLAQQRYRLGFVRSDFALRRETVPYVLARGDEATPASHEAHATHDGYFSLLVPLGEGDLNVAVLFGRLYHWIQIESVQLIPTAALFQDDESHHTVDVSDRVLVEDMVQHPNGLLECRTESALLYVPAELAEKARGRLACRIVYRPIAYRQGEPADDNRAA